MAKFVDAPDRLDIHVVARDGDARSALTGIVLLLGHSATTYSDLAELLHVCPYKGIILVQQHAADGDMHQLLGRLGKQGIALPVIVAAANPRTEEVVASIKSGAVDYLQMPVEANCLARSLSRVVEEARVHGKARYHRIDAKCRVQKLSRRERQVLEHLVGGCSNKVIARHLGISPRTVEIHRANMMTKLRANNAAEAVRIWLLTILEVGQPCMDEGIFDDRFLPTGIRKAHSPMDHVLT